MYSTCNDIPLKLFIEVYMGNKRALVKKGNPPEKVINETAYQMICEYTDIVNSKGVQFEIDSRSKLIKYDTKVKCLEIVKMLILRGDYRSANEILEILKLRKNLVVTEDNKESILNILQSEIAMTKWNLDSLLRRIASDKSDRKPTKSSFYREIALISQHFKMQIDINKCPASIYANYVRNMIEEIKTRKSWQTKQK